MKLAILSDIHSNLEALTAVLDVVAARGVDEVYCLGDLVGYGADPAACVDLVREVCTGVVRGNHDEAVALHRGESFLPQDARRAAYHNRAQLSPEHLAFLAGLPYWTEAHGCTFVHATPDIPKAWRRVRSFAETWDQFNYFATDVCFLGHTHFPAVVAERIGVINVRRGSRFIINVGSVGQPRDYDPRACVGFFDTEAFSYELVRVEYDLDAAIEKIHDAGLPARLGVRLAMGE